MLVREVPSIRQAGVRLMWKPLLEIPQSNGPPVKQGLPVLDEDQEIGQAGETNRSQEDQHGKQILDWMMATSGYHETNL